MRTILVIKLGALGDFIHAFHAFAAIRAHHAADRVVLLTTAPFVDIGRRSPWFDAVLVDERAGWWNLKALRRTIGVIRGADFVYDLQTSRRTNRYFWLARGVAWSGIAAGCSHPHVNPRRDFIHTIERQQEQLVAAGIERFPTPRRDWLSGGPRPLPSPYALLVPGGAGVGSVKRWPVARYAEMAIWLVERGVAPVVIGGTQERGLGEAIVAACPAAVDLTGRTSVFELAAIAADAVLVVGNDTGPMHLAASMGAPTIALFSAASSPEQAGPRGPAGERAGLLREDVLASLPVERVADAVDRLLGHRD